MACHGILFHGEDHVIPANYVIPKSSYKLKEIKLDDYKSVIKLDLSSSNVESITNDFEGLEHLEWLNLYDNKIKHLKSNQFKGLVSLKNLVLNYCEIETIEKDCFSQLDQLKALRLYDNKIKFF